MEILKDDILQLNFHTFIGSWAQFEELHELFINLGAHLPLKHNSPKGKLALYFKDGPLKKVFTAQVMIPMQEINNKKKKGFESLQCMMA